MSRYSHGRSLYPEEQEAWDEYDAALDSVENSRGFDRVSVHNAFPHIKAAFKKLCKVSDEYSSKHKSYQKMNKILGFSNEIT